MNRSISVPELVSEGAVPPAHFTGVLANPSTRTAKVCDDPPLVICTVHSHDIPAAVASDTVNVQAVAPDGVAVMKFPDSTDTDTLPDMLPSSCIVLATGDVV
jgi:hypothetical protein